MTIATWRARTLEWLSSHAMWELFKWFLTAIVGSGIIGWGVSQLRHGSISTAFNISLVVLGVLLLGWRVGLFPIRKKNDRISYSIAEMQGNISILSVGIGPQFYVNVGRLFTIESVELTIVNLLPFQVEFESLQVDILLEGTNLGTKDANVSLTIAGNSIGRAYLRHDLTDNQAQLARNYRDRYSCCPLFRMGGKANFRTPHGLLTIGVQTEIRSVIHPDRV